MQEVIPPHITRSILYTLDLNECVVPVDTDKLDVFSIGMIQALDGKIGLQNIFAQSANGIRLTAMPIEFALCDNLDIVQGIL